MNMALMFNGNSDAVSLALPFLYQAPHVQPEQIGPQQEFCLVFR